jgi:hypothetical protein
MERKKSKCGAMITQQRFGLDGVEKSVVRAELQRGTESIELIISK